MNTAPGRALVLFGPTGRMGQAIVGLLRANPAWRLAAAIGSPHSAAIGRDAASPGEPIGVPVTADGAQVPAGAQVALDFSVAAAVAAHARACAQAGVPLLVGTTGLDEAALAALREASRRIAVLVAPNTSIGVGVLASLVGAATRALGPDYDVEIVEAHHAAKRDAPSGTALALGEAVAAQRGQALASVADRDRARAHGARTPGSIGFAVVRAGDIVGEHTVVFATAGERLELTHRATDRQVFAHGALRCAAWLATQPAGLYGMQDVLRG